MKKKIIFGIILIMVGTTSILYFKPFAKSEIIILEHLTEHHENKIDQIFLIKNPPRSSKGLYNLINDFNKENTTSNGLYNRLFIKEHNYDPPFLPFAWNIDYAAETTTRNDLDNMDFLVKSIAYIAFDGDTIKSIQVYGDDAYHYEK